MIMFQRRHFNKIAFMAGKMNLSEKQLSIMLSELKGTNGNFDEQRFRKYVEESR